MLRMTKQGRKTFQRGSVHGHRVMAPELGMYVSLGGVQHD